MGSRAVLGSHHARPVEPHRDPGGARSKGGTWSGLALWGFSGCMWRTDRGTQGRSREPREEVTTVVRTRDEEWVRRHLGRWGDMKEPGSSALETARGLRLV